MAESKKTKKTASPKAAAAKSGASKGDAKNAAAKPATPAMPMMDTSLAAEAAARMVKHGLSGQGGAPEAAGEKQESAAFRQLKQNLSKPGASGVAGFLQSTAPQKKSNLPFSGPNQQVRRNQTFGADVNRTGVPRRTGG